MKTRIKKFSSFLFFALQGMFLVSTMSIAETINIPEGAIIQIADNYDVYIVKYKNESNLKDWF